MVLARIVSDLDNKKVHFGVPTAALGSGLRWTTRKSEWRSLSEPGVETTGRAPAWFFLEDIQVGATGKVHFGVPISALWRLWEGIIAKGECEGRQ